MPTRRALLASLFTALLFLVSGCDARLVGTHDKTLSYAVEGNVGTSAALEALVRLRLAAAHVAADVAVDPRTQTLAVTVDAEEAHDVAALLAWRGGVAIYRIDPSPLVVLKAEPGLAVERPAGDGEDAVVLRGERASVQRAVHAAAVDPEHLVLEEPIDHATSRTRVVAVADALDLARGIAHVTSENDGRDLAIELAPAAREPVAVLAEASSRGAASRWVVAWGHQVLGPLALDEAGRIRLPFGRDLFAYERVYETRKILSTPPLPRLAPLGERDAKLDLPLALSAALLPILLSLGWLAVVRRFDRATPAPWRSLLVTFGLGAAMVVPAGLIERALYHLSPFLNPHLMALGGQILGLPGAFAAAVLTIGLPEEGTKLLAAWAVSHRRRDLHEPIDGITFGAAAALGFAAAENVSYFDRGRLALNLVVGRTFHSAPGHVFFSAIWGYYLGVALVDRRSRLGRGVLLAALAHGAYDAFCLIDELGFLSHALNLGLALVFVWLLRRALRRAPRAGAHGRLSLLSDPGGTPSPGAGRLVAVGRPGEALIAGAGVVVLAWALLSVSRTFEAEHHRQTFAFLAVSASLVIGLGLLSTRFAETMTLDAVLDERGITFCGVARKWSAVLGVDKRPAVGLFGPLASLVVRSVEGDLVVGPADPRVVAELEAEVARRLDA